MIYMRTDYHFQILKLTDKLRVRWSPTWMDALPLCMFLKLRVYFVKIVDLVGLVCPVTDHMGFSNYAITYADN